MPIEETNEEKTFRDRENGWEEVETVVETEEKVVGRKEKNCQPQ